MTTLAAQRLDDTCHRSSRLFRTATTLVLSCLIVLLLWGIPHRCSNPRLLGLYSPLYAAGLVSLVLGAALFARCLLRPTRRLVHWAGNAYILLFSVAIVMVALEGLLRVSNLFGIEYFSLLMSHGDRTVNDSELGYVHPREVTYYLGRNRVVLNSRGLRRNSDIAYDKPVGEKRVLVLGDSVAFGWGVNQGETFSELMEPLLQNRTAENWKVLNSGVNGYNSEQEAKYFRIEGSRYSPDIVILIYVPNDVEPSIPTLHSKTGWPSSPWEGIGRVRQHCLLYQLAMLNLRKTEYSKFPSIVQHPGWSRSRTALEDIAAGCKSAGIPFLVALCGGSEFKCDMKFIQELKRTQIDAICLEPAWQNVPPRNRRVSRIDSHPSAAVHFEVAKLLVDELETRSWISSSRN